MAQPATEAKENFSAVFFPVGVLIGSVWEHVLLRSNVSFLMGYGFILHENALSLTLCCQKALAENLR